MRGMRTAFTCYLALFFKQKNLDDTKHGPSIIWSGRVVNEWHQMCHNGVTLIIFLGACAERSYFSAADASKYKMRLRRTPLGNSRQATRPLWKSWKNAKLKKSKSKIRIADRAQGNVKISTSTTAVSQGGNKEALLGLLIKVTRK